MNRVTLDTNVLPADDLLRAAPAGEFEFAVVDVTEAEVADTPFAVTLKPLGLIPRSTPFGYGPYGAGTYGGSPDPACLEKALEIIGSGSFPPPNHRENLTSGQLRQYRDALILCTHVRDGRDIFVTDDRRGFINNSRRKLLQDAFRTLILTRAEFAVTLGLAP